MSRSEQDPAVHAPEGPPLPRSDSQGAGGPLPTRGQPPIDLLNAAEALVLKLDAVSIHGGMDGIFAFASVHGVTYDGPTYEADLEQLREAIAAADRELA